MFLSDFERFSVSGHVERCRLFGDCDLMNNGCVRVMVCTLQGNLAVASVYAGSDSVQLKGDEIIVELYELLRLLTLCMLFSKKPFPVFLDSAGFSLDDVLIQKPKAGVCFVLMLSLSLYALLLFICVFYIIWGEWWRGVGQTTRSHIESLTQRSDEFRDSGIILTFVQKETTMN